ncbi:hypothetical protein KMW28_18240 [Flammeovirga yaeyamensis]|uniref:Uncharacterized protein n=1 Tax=Flammeovirga yaeyamensis TaxID=367791 RepID=A0AAX1N205_9BACT|nr:hypothetical protein [Flammeovirga yaeyamensis]MBB3701103.1 hypothetical protein [Flammeovirga yaeyamensis]NMF38430.1 hypothetical protein [Flammeovirga yaeyamensis]QWG01570.1 hypothetical protein KMW28_18240 [Flammeovirga yaeyamensis]
MKKLLFFLASIIVSTQLMAVNYYPNGDQEINSWTEWQNTSNWTRVGGGTGYPILGDKVILGNSKSLTIDFDLPTNIGGGIYMELEADGRLINGVLNILGDLNMEEANVQIEIYGYLEIEDDMNVDNGNLFLKNGGELIVNDNFTRLDIGSGQIEIAGDGTRLVVEGNFYDGHYTPLVFNAPTIEITGACFTKEGSFCDINLPVELVSFEVKKDGFKNIILWKTAQEINNDYFILLKSYDKINWIEIERKEGAGNSNTTLSYSVVDSNIEASGKIYYQLIQVDFDGTETVYGPLMVLDGQSQDIVKVYTYGDRFAFMLGDEIKNIKYTVISSNGAMRHFEGSENNYFEISKTDLYQGINIIHIYFGAKIYSKKIYN